jgi:hypothetical protein
MILSDEKKKTNRKRTGNKNQLSQIRESSQQMDSTTTVLQLRPWIQNIGYR